MDDAINNAVLRVLEDTHCYVTSATLSGYDGTTQDYTLDSSILDIQDLYLTSNTTRYDMERVSIEYMNELRRFGVPTGSPARYYSVQGWNLIMFWPPPGSGDTLTVYYIPIPTALSNDTDDPSDTTYGGVPSVLHRAIFYFACSDLASYDDDQSSAQGQRYRDWYDKEITRYKTLVRKRGGNRNARAIVNDKRRRRAFHDNSVYPGGSSW